MGPKYCIRYRFDTTRSDCFVHFAETLIRAWLTLLKKSTCTTVTVQDSMQPVYISVFHLALKHASRHNVAHFPVPARLETQRSERLPYTVHDR